MRILLIMLIALMPVVSHAARRAETDAAETLATIARGERDFASRVFALCAGSPLAQARTIPAKVCAHLATTEALYAGLDLLDDLRVPPIPYALLEAAKGVFVEKRPSRQIANAYSLVPAYGQRRSRTAVRDGSARR